MDDPSLYGPGEWVGTGVWVYNRRPNPQRRPSRPIVLCFEDGAMKLTPSAATKFRVGLVRAWRNETDPVLRAEMSALADALREAITMTLSVTADMEAERSRRYRARRREEHRLALVRDLQHTTNALQDGGV